MSRRLPVFDGIAHAADVDRDNGFPQRHPFEKDHGQRLGLGGYQAHDAIVRCVRSRDRGPRLRGVRRR